jgi:hypothetical protein
MMLLVCVLGALLAYGSLSICHRLKVPRAARKFVLILIVVPPLLGVSYLEWATGRYNPRR